MTLAHCYCLCSPLRLLLTPTTPAYSYSFYSLLRRLLNNTAFSSSHGTLTVISSIFSNFQFFPIFFKTYFGSPSLRVVKKIMSMAAQKAAKRL